MLAGKPEGGWSAVRLSEETIPVGNTKNIAFWIILFLLMVALFNVFSNGSRTSMGREISYSDFLNRVEAGQVAAVRLDGERVYVTTADGASFQTIQPRGNDVSPTSAPTASRSRRRRRSSPASCRRSACGCRSCC